MEAKSYGTIKQGIIMPKAVSYMIRLELARESDVHFLKKGVETGDI